MDYNDDACFNWFSEPEDSLMKENFFLNTCSFKNNNILIVGLGKSVIACVNYLSKQIEYKKKSEKLKRNSVLFKLVSHVFNTRREIVLLLH